MILKGKVAFVAGGARIGAEVASALAARGCAVALTWRRSSAKALEAVRACRDRGTPAQAFRADLRNPGHIPPLVRRAARWGGRLDILIHMASVYEPAPLRNLTPGGWDDTMAVDLRSAGFLAHACAPFMKRQGTGRIVLFSDWTAASGRPRYKNLLPYYTAKSAVVGLTEALALELAPAILVNAVAPGPILPPAGARSREIAEVKRATPLRRWGGPEEISKAVLFLLQTDFVTGECLRVDGGRHLL